MPTPNRRLYLKMEVEEIRRIAGDISRYSILLPLIGILICGRLLPSKLYPIRFLIGFWVIVQFLVSYHYLFGLVNGIPIVNIAIIIELLLITLIYKKYGFSRIHNIIYLYVNLLFILFAIIYYSQFDIEKHAPIVRSIQSFIIITLAVGYFMKLLISQEQVDVYKDPLFWFSSGALIFFGGNLSYRIFRQHIAGMGLETQYMILIGFEFINIIFNLFVFFGLINCRRLSKSLASS